MFIFLLPYTEAISFISNLDHDTKMSLLKIKTNNNESELQLMIFFFLIIDYAAD